MTAVTQAGQPRWLTLGGVRAGVAVLHEAHGGRRWRHVVKTLVTPHLTVPGRRLLLGVAPCHPGGWRRVSDSALHFGWLVSWSVREWRWSNGQESLPWGLRPERAGTWRLVNLARSAADREAARYTPGLGSFALALADRHGAGVRAEVGHGDPRLLRVYQLRGFRVVGSDERNLLLARAPVSVPYRQRPVVRAAWRRVLRTGRTRQDSWRVRFGLVEGPFGPLLDVGSGDSPLSGELAGDGVRTVTLDPQYALQAPAVRLGRAVAVAGVAEALPFRDGVFAVANASHALQHIAGVRFALLELLRVARPDGVLIIHPAWGGRRRRRKVAGLPGTRLVPGRFLPPRRQRPSLVIHLADFDLVAGLDPVAGVARPGRVARVLGAVAMRLVIRARGTTAVGPGAVGPGVVR